MRKIKQTFSVFSVCLTEIKLHKSEIEFERKGKENVTKTITKVETHHEYIGKLGGQFKFRVSKTLKAQKGWDTHHVTQMAICNRNENV